MRIFLFFSLLLICEVSFANARDQFFSLRQRHLGEKAVAYFTANLDKRSADLLLNSKIKPPYRVTVEYSSEKGIELRVRDTDPFYEYYLESQARSVNMLLLPLLNTTAYTRLQARFEISFKEGVYTVSYLKGDIPAKYEFFENNTGLVYQIFYYEQNKKQLQLNIAWEKIDQFFVPKNFKTITYVPSRQSATFNLENILLK